MKIAVIGKNSTINPMIKQLLYPWKVTFVESGEADVQIVHGIYPPPEHSKTIVIPENSQSFAKWVNSGGRSLCVKTNSVEQILEVASSETVLSLLPKTSFHYQQSGDFFADSTKSSFVHINGENLVLAVDVFKEYSRIFCQGIDPKGAILYRLLTGLPISYTIVPKRIRNFVVVGQGSKEELNFIDKMPLDTLRYMIVNAIEEITKKKLERKLWCGKRYGCMITHDIDTRLGLERARIIKKLEEKYNIMSTWYIPSKHYSLNPDVVRDLANFGEVGAHDSKHDGKLADMSSQKMLERVTEAKSSIEAIVGHPIVSFRAPLLQHNLKIFQALQNAGYRFDSSVPSWEPKHPYVMNSHGIGTLYTLKVDKMVEIPVTLPQDDQMLHVMGMSPEETVKTWNEMRKTISDIGGIASFLIHPDYEFAFSKNLGIYEELLNELACDNTASICTSAEVSE